MDIVIPFYIWGQLRPKEVTRLTKGHMVIVRVGGRVRILTQISLNLKPTLGYYLPYSCTYYVPDIILNNLYNNLLIVTIIAPRTLFHSFPLLFSADTHTSFKPVTHFEIFLLNCQSPRWQCEWWEECVCHTAPLHKLILVDSQDLGHMLLNFFVPQGSHLSLELIGSFELWFSRILW